MVPPIGANRRSSTDRPYNPGVSRVYTLHDAEAMIPELAVVADRLQALRAEVVDLRDAYALHEAEADESDPELRRLRLRIRGIVDQMQADAAWLDEREIVLRDISVGLVDFPAIAAGRSVWLCWRLGEPSISAWHLVDEGFAGRRPIEELEPEPDASPHEGAR